MQPQMIVTIQPVGATFDPPARLTLPNVDGHAPGAQVEMYSFDHDLEEFVAIGLGFVSEDGTVVTSSTGVGVVKAGWHCGSQPGGSGTVHNCPTCQKCENDDCVDDPAQSEVVLAKQTEGDCKIGKCKGQENDDSDKPTEDKIVGDCSAPGCSGGNIDWALLADPTDIKEEDAKCKTCGGAEGKELITDKSKESLACGSSDPSEACYTCKDGNCGNQCEASSEKTTKTIEITDEDPLYQGLKIIQEKAPYVRLDVKGSFSLSEETGEKCCKDCTKGPDPKKYTQIGIKGAGSLDALFIVPGLGLVYELPEKSYGPLELGGGVEFGPGTKGKLELSAAGKSETSECDADDETCSELSLVGGGVTAIGIFAKIKGSVAVCSFFDEDDCDDVAAGEAEAASAFNFSANFTNKIFNGENCTKANCYSYQYGKAEFKSEVQYKVEVAGIYKFQYQNDISVTLGESGVGGTCGKN